MNPHKVDALTYMMTLRLKGVHAKRWTSGATTPANPRQVQTVAADFYSGGRRDVFLPPLFILAFRQLTQSPERRLLDPVVP